MSALNSTAALSALLRVESAAEFEDWLRDVAGSEVFTDQAHWRQVGNQRSNAGAIDQSADEINPLVERIVNGMEAVVQLNCNENGFEPQSPSHAIEEIFDVRDGRCRNLDDSSAQQLAQFVKVTLRGESRAGPPTIDVRDFGIGVHPTEFPDTILALGQSLKGQLPYLVGMYGQGGSSSFDKCTYTVIMSRKARSQLKSEQRDQIGWTVVRKTLNVRSPQYQYFVNKKDGSVPWISRSISDSIGFQHGTLVMHIGYQNLGGFATQQITNNAFYTLNYRLFDPLLPWTLIDERASQRVSRTMRGVPYRVARLPLVFGIGGSESRPTNRATAVRHRMEYTHQRGAGSSLRIAWWVLQDEQAVEGRRRRAHHERLRPYRDQSRRYARRAIAVTRGGQTHAALTAANTFRKKNFRQLSRSTVVQVDTDGLNWGEIADFFTSNRADLKTGSFEQIEEAIEAAIDLHSDVLRAIERERQAELVAGRAASDEDEIRRHLDPMIQAFQRASARRGNSTTGGGKSTNFRGRQVPTFLRFARANELRVRPGVPTRVQLLVDAVDNVVKHPQTRMRVEATNPGLVRGAINGGDGRYTVSLSPSPELVPGTKIQLTASISRPNAWFLQTEQPLRIIVQAPPPPFEGTFPPTHLAFRSQNGVVHVRQGGARISIRSDATNDSRERGAILEVESPDPVQLPIEGWSGPSNGEFRVGVNIPEDAPLGSAGAIVATLHLPNGTRLDDIAELVVDKRLEPFGKMEAEWEPNYEIRNVVEIPLEDGEISWAEMPGILEGSNKWSSQDVGAFLETGDGAEKKITFYLNADNADLLAAERQLANHAVETAVDSFRTMQRTLLCFHLYKLAAAQSPDSETDYGYREEMIRVSQTLTFTHNRFLQSLATNA